MMPARTLKERPRPYTKSGLYTLKRAVAVLGSRALPSKRSALGRALGEWRASLLADLGGVDAVSTQQLALVDLAVRSKLLVDSVDAYVLSMPSPVNRQRRCLHPVARERQALVGQLQSILRDLGLERRTGGLDLAAQLAAKRQHEVLPPLHLRRAPRELPRLGIPVRPGSARELPLARADEVGELEEVLEVLRQLLVDDGEVGGAEVVPPWAVVGKEEVGEVQPGGVKAQLGEPVGPPEQREVSSVA